MGFPSTPFPIPTLCQSSQQKEANNEHTNYDYGSPCRLRPAGVHDGYTHPHRPKEIP